jgi:hypothetical protein
MLYRPLRDRLADLRFGRGDHTGEPSRLIIGSTGSGKSAGELVELVRLAGQRHCAVVLLDGHGPLAFQAAGHWAARGHAGRLVFEPLDAHDRVLCWSFLPRSAASSPARRQLEDAETIDAAAQCFLAQRNWENLSDRPWTREWLEAALRLCLAQPREEPLTSLLSAFRVGSPEYERLLQEARDPEVVRKFREAERIRRRSEVQYETLTGASRRLVEPVCTSPVVRLRVRPGAFDWLAALEQKKLIAVDGGGVRSAEIKRTLFLLVSLQVIQSVRRHFAEHQRLLPVVLVLEEAGALGLVTPFVQHALRELRKAGLAVHVLTQSCLDFGDPLACEMLLSNTPWQAWYQCLSPADQELGARALANATFDAHALHFQRTRQMSDGVTPVETITHGRSLGAHGELLRQDTRAGQTLVPRYRAVSEDHYKTPQLHMQEFRTHLATLRIGERWVRDRRGVYRERVRLLRPPRLRHLFEVRTRAVIAEIRRQPMYQAVEFPSESPPPSLPGAATVLRQRMDSSPAPPGPPP